MFNLGFSLLETHRKQPKNDKEIPILFAGYSGYRWVDFIFLFPVGFEGNSGTSSICFAIGYFTKPGGDKAGKMAIA
jgi:hypothetical protein